VISEPVQSLRKSAPRYATGKWAVHYLSLSEDDLKMPGARVKIVVPRRPPKVFGSLLIVLLLDGVDYTDLLILEQLQYQHRTVFIAMSWQ